MKVTNLKELWQGNEINFNLIERSDTLELFDYYRALRESHFT